MNKTVITGLVAGGALLAVVGILYVMNSNSEQQQPETAQAEMMKEDTDTMMEGEEGMEDTDAMMEKDDTMMPDEAETMMEDEEYSDSMMEKEDAMMEGEGMYVTYSAEAFEEAADKKRVYFFHASWCPTCRTADEEFTSQSAEIPADVVVFKINYDEEATLKDEYGVTSQHTFVYVDESGNEIAKWNGGDIAELQEYVN